MSKGRHFTEAELFYIRTGIRNGRRPTTIAKDLGRTSAAGVRKAATRIQKERKARTERADVATRRNRVQQLLHAKIRKRNPKTKAFEVVGRKYGTGRALQGQLVAEGFDARSISTALRDARARGARCLVRAKVADDTQDKNLARFVAALQLLKVPAENYIFCDETHVNSNDNTNRKEWVPAGEKPTSRHFLKRAQCRLMIWAAIGFNFKSDLVFFDRDGPNHTAAITGAKYADVCAPLIERCLRRNKRRYVFVQDNARPHLPVGKSLIQNGFRVAEWPPYSPHLNPIEHLWSLLHRNVAFHFPRTDEDLQAAARVEWAKFSLETVNRFVQNFHSQLRACVDAGGAPT